MFLPDFVIQDYILIMIGYFLGAIPFGLLLTRGMGIGDLRKVGSGNIGATNVMRAGGSLLGVITLFLDGLKGIIAIVVAIICDREHLVEIVAVASVVGHIFPVWLGFKGGKGVATAFAVILTLSGYVWLLMTIVWVIVFAVGGIVSLASVCAFVVAPLIVIMLFGVGKLFYATLFLSFLVIIRHYKNMQRIMLGTEPRIFYRE
jgi:glycerol-3-phosphate acyltransferase PlsY